MVTLHLPWKFHANWSSRFLVILLTKKQRKKDINKETNKQRNRSKTIPRPRCIGGGVTKWSDRLRWKTVMIKVVIDTSVWTIAGRCVNSILTVWNISTTPSYLIRSRTMLSVTKTPVRPTPALHYKTMCNEIQGSHILLTKKFRTFPGLSRTPVRNFPAPFRSPRMLK